MIDLYSWGTSNGRKVSIMLEECGLPYRAHPVNIGKGEQFSPAFVALNPNGKIPAIVDSEGQDGKPLRLFESGAILVYLAGKTGRFLPLDVRGKYEALQWLMFQMGGIGPVFGRTHHFLRAAKEPDPYGIERFSTTRTCTRSARPTMPSRSPAAPASPSARPPRATPNQPSMRSAMAGEIAARSFRTRDKATRVTPSCIAASETESPNAGSTSSLNVAPGCGGFCMRLMVLPFSGSRHSPRVPRRYPRT